MSTPSSIPGSGRSSNASGGRGRPVPVLPTEVTEGNAEDSANGQPLDDDSDNDVLRHNPSSSSRTKFTTQTPETEKAAIQNLRTKINFSEHSAPSSTASTPSKSQKPVFPPKQLERVVMTDPSKLRTARLQKTVRGSASPTTHLVAAKAEVNGDDRVDEASEAEIDSSVTISALLSKLDSVRNFLKEAETLHQRFQDRVSEPGVAEQIAKLETLIAELKEQESSHLSVLLAVMAAGELKGGGGGLTKKDLELSEDEESEEGESEGDSESDIGGDDPANQTVIKATNNDSFSLRAQIQKRLELEAEQDQQLAVLKQHKELLEKLLTQQKQIQELELKQAALLKMKQEAQAQIAEAEAKTAEIQRLTKDVDERLSKAGEMESGQLEPAQSSEEWREKSPTSATPSPTSAGAPDRSAVLEERMMKLDLNDATSEPLSVSQEKLLLMKLAELKARKQRVEQLVGLLSAMRTEDSLGAAATAPTGTLSALAKSGKSLEAPTAATSQGELLPAEAGDAIGLSAEATGRNSGPSELVHDDETEGMAELQERIKKAEEARKKLRELQEMIAQLHDHSPENSEPEDDISAPAERLSWRLSKRQDSSGHGQVGMTSSGGEDSDDEAEEEEEAGNETLNTTVTEDFDPAEQSLVEEYQKRLAAKRREVTELQRQRDELKRTHERLLMLQSHILVPGDQEDVSQVKAKPSGKGQPRRNRAEEKVLDTTNATWGGSTLPSELEEGEKSPDSGSSVSLPSAILTSTGTMMHDSILPHAAALAGSASVEQQGASQGKPPFKVTRHTPRNVPSQRSYRMRTISSPAEQTQSKRRKLDSQNLNTSVSAWQTDPQEIPRPTNPNPYSATYFTSPQQPAPPQLDTSHMSVDSAQCYTSVLYSQLAVTSNMCSELLHAQNSLIGAVCSHLEMCDYQAGIQHHYSMLKQYQKELEQYYHDLYQSYSQIANTQGSGGFQSAGDRTEPEDPVGSVNEQQQLFDGTQGSAERASSPAVLENSEAAAQGSNAQLNEDTPRMPPPPPPVLSQPHPFHFTGYPGQQAGPGEDMSFSANAETAANTGEGNTGLAAPHIPPPIPPSTFNPYTFHSPYYMPPFCFGSPPMPRSYVNAPPFGGFGFGPPPPPPLSSFGFSHSPQFAPPRPNPLPVPGYRYRSPMSYPRPHHWSHHSPGVTTMFGDSLGQGPPHQFAPPPFPLPPPPLGAPPYPHPFLQPPPPFGHPTFGVGHPHSHPPPSFPPGASLSTSLADRSMLGNLRPSTLLPPQAHLHDDHLGFHSPSGITAASLQVQPPSSPPSAPSVNLQPSSSNQNLQPSSSNQNNCNATNTAMPTLGASESSTTCITSSSVLDPSSTGGTLQYPAFLPAGGTSNASPLTKAMLASSDHRMDGGIGHFQFSAAAKPSSLTEMNATSVAQGRGYNFESLKPGTMDGASASAGIGESGEGAERGEREGARGSHQPELEDGESVSSLPVSIPEELSHLQLDALANELLLSRQQQLEEEEGEEDEDEEEETAAALATSDPASGYLVFDVLRETIYSEVATLIANNESRPHFLVELFRELQMLTTDYLRQRALFDLQDLVTRYLTEEGVAREAKVAATTGNHLFQGWVAGSVSEHTPSESGMTTEEETGADQSKPLLVKSNSQKYDYIEPVRSASSMSTPPRSSSFSDEPFASDNLGATAVRLDKDMAKVKGQVVIGGDAGFSPLGLTPPVISPGPLKTDEEFMVVDVNAEQLDELIKVIMTQVIPIFKENLESCCTSEMLDQVKQIIVGLLAEQEGMTEPKQGLFAAFAKQLEVAISAAADKYSEKLLKDCGEDLLVEISEVLFNELTFFRLLKESKGHPQLSAGFASQSTTENEDNEGGENKTPLVSQVAEASTTAVADSRQPLDPNLLQALCVLTTANLAEEEEALGKLRDDDLAATWDTKIQERDRSSVSADEDVLAKMVELSLSESQPFNSTGSGEEDNSGTQITAVALDSAQSPPLTLPQPTCADAKEVTATPHHEAEPEQLPLIDTQGNDGVVDQAGDANEAEGGGGGGGGETPPMPQATEQPNPKPTDPSEATAHSICAEGEGERDDKSENVESCAHSDDGEEGNQGTGGDQEGKEEGVKTEIEAVTGVGMGTADDNLKREEAVSPPTAALMDKLTIGIDEAILEAQMKKEQEDLEGVAGILASIDETGPIELAGDDNELVMPTPDYVEP